MSERGCKLATVVAAHGCSVCVCAHGTLHVSMGSITIRMGSDALDPLVDVLSRAASKLKEADQIMEDAQLH